MSSLINHYKNFTRIGMVILLTTTAWSMAGCSTTQTFKPTASVMVGTQTTL